MQWGAYLGLAAAAVALVQLLVPAGGHRRRRRWSWPSGSGSCRPACRGSGDTGRSRSRRFTTSPPTSTARRNSSPCCRSAPTRPTPATYGGEEVAQAQEKAYPDIRPLELGRSRPRRRSPRAAAVRAEGWDLVAADSSAGRIEATATTGWFGFKDDVVVRIEPQGAGSKVDVRSVSRVGGSDVGTNARRIREYLRRLAG